MRLCSPEDKPRKSLIRFLEMLRKRWMKQWHGWCTLQATESEYTRDKKEDAHGDGLQREREWNQGN